MRCQDGVTRSFTLDWENKEGDTAAKCTDMDVDMIIHAMQCDDEQLRAGCLRHYGGGAEAIYACGDPIWEMRMVVNNGVVMRK